MFNVGKNYDAQESNLIRLHPKAGGVDIDFGSQHFRGVSADLFFGLDLNDFSRTYQNTRKLNISISINPSHWDVEQFLSYLTAGNLERTQKCTFHGDRDTGLRASNKLMSLLKFDHFDVDGVHYAYDSIGAACNRSYASVSHRKGNVFEKSSSHFEIKFRRQSGEEGPDEYLCLNIHLMPEKILPFGKPQALERLKQAIRLFYAELGLSSTASNPYTFRTNLKLALTVTLGDYEENGFSCKHEQSLDALENNGVAVKYTHFASENRGLSLWSYVQKAEKEKLHIALDAVSVTTDVPSPAEDVKSAPNAWSKKLAF
jgi:hypothetical protein